MVKILRWEYLTPNQQYDVDYAKRWLVQMDRMGHDACRLSINVDSVGVITDMVERRGFEVTQERVNRFFPVTDLFLRRLPRG